MTIHQKRKYFRARVVLIEAGTDRGAAYDQRYLVYQDGISSELVRYAKRWAIRKTPLPVNDRNFDMPGWVDKTKPENYTLYWLWDEMTLTSRLRLIPPL